MRSIQTSEVTSNVINVMLMLMLCQEVNEGISGVKVMHLLESNWMTFNAMHAKPSLQLCEADRLASTNEHPPEAGRAAFTEELSKEADMVASSPELFTSWLKG